MLMKLHLITWPKDFLLIWGGARQTALWLVVLRSAFEQRVKEEERKNHLQDPPPTSCPPAQKKPISWQKGGFSSNANANTELTSGTAAKDDNLLPILMIQFAICILANWELEWDQWVILHWSLYSGPEWNCWPGGESLSFYFWSLWVM